MGSSLGSSVAMTGLNLSEWAVQTTVLCVSHTVVWHNYHGVQTCRSIDNHTGVYMREISQTDTTWWDVNIQLSNQ